MGLKNLFSSKKKKKLRPTNLEGWLEASIANILEPEDFAKNQVFINNISDPLSKVSTVLCFLAFQDKNKFIAGGYRTILAVNNAISQKFSAKIYFCFFPAQKNKDRISEYQSAMAEHFPNMNYEIVSYEDAFNLDADIAICNFWLGAYPLLKFNNCKRKYYLVQDYETVFYPSGTASCLAELSYTFGFHKLTNSQALKKRLEAIDSMSPIHRYYPGIDHSLYYPIKNKSFIKDKYKIIFYGRPKNSRNAFTLLSQAFIKLKDIVGDKIEIISVGENYDVKDYNLEGIVTNLGCFNSLSELADLYRECDIGLSFITTPTFSYQHMEFMASGLCLVTNEQDGIMDMFTDNENAVICKPVASIVAKRIADLINHPENMKNISCKGQEFTSKLDWNKCFDGICDFILKN